MRRQRITWTIIVLGIVATIYGSFTLVYHLLNGNGLKVRALILLVFGIVALATYASLYLYDVIKKKNNNLEIIDNKVEEVAVEKKEPKEPVKQETPKIDKTNDTVYESPKRRSSYESSSSYAPSYSSTVYVKKVGYGPILRVQGSIILDMRSNTYYRIENNRINQDGYGPRFEIVGNQIRDVFGGYLFELSGNNINKTYGGFYASVSGNYINLFDLSEKYEMSDSLSKKQILVVAALLFGNH